MKKLLLIFLVIMEFTRPVIAQCPPNASAFVSVYPQCAPLGCGVLLKDWPEGVVVNIYGGSPITIIASAPIPGNYGGPALDNAFVCVPCNIPLIFASAIPGATSGCVIVTLGVVPVKLTNFSVNTTNTNSCLIKWNTSNEPGGTKYTVQRSYDSKNFIDLTSFEANTNSSSTYSYTDNLLQQGVIFYRIKITDLLGKISYSETALVKKQASLNISIYPNPIESYFNVTIPGQFLPAKIMMYNSLGKLVYSTTTSQSNLSVNERFSKGVYAIRVSGKNNTTITQTVLIK